MDPDIDDFEYQLAQEAREAQLKQRQSKANTESSKDANGEDKAAIEAAIDAEIAANPNLYKDPSGTIYEWNHKRHAWFPKIDDNFIAVYQANYGVKNQVEGTETDGNGEEAAASTSSSSDKKEKDNEESTVAYRLAGKRKAEEKAEPTWFDVDDEHNTNVYVSNLPLDIDDDEFETLMKKCGMIMKDEKNQYKIKLYRDEQGNLKGDGRCCYIKVESVKLALDILDESDFKGNKIKVERAKFSLKGQFDPTKKPKTKKNKDKAKMKKKIDKLFDWRPEKLPGERGKNELMVVIKNMFDPKEFEKEPKLILEYRSDLRDECARKFGEVKRVDIYDLHPEGVATVMFKEFEHADECVAKMNGRWFAGRQLDASHWDGKSKYRVQESEEEEQKRIEQWDKFLEGE